MRGSKPEYMRGACSIDISASVLAFAKGAAIGCDRASFVQADAQTYPFAQAHFDANLSQARLWVRRLKNGLSVEHPIPECALATAMRGKPKRGARWAI